MAVTIRPGQWLTGGAPIYADTEDGECVVTFDSEVAIDPRLDQTPEPDAGMSIHSPGMALQIASAAATRAKARGSIDAFGRIMVTRLDLPAREAD